MDSERTSARKIYGPASMIRLILLLVGMTMALAGPAAANTLVFTRDGNVWLATPDGSRTHQVTTDGSPSSPYESPSQTDNGIIVAKKGTGAGSSKLYRMRQNGELLNPPVDTPAPGTGALEPKVAPDGSLIAYYFLTVVSGTCPGCAQVSDRSLYSYPDRFTTHEEIPGPRCCQHPTWMANEGVLLSSGSPTVWYHRLGQPEAQQWFADSDTVENSFLGFYGGELSTAGDRLAMIRGDSQESIAIYSTNGPPPATPTIRCSLTEPTGAFATPTWSPDGQQLAWQEGNGVSIAGFPDLGNCSAGAPPRLAFPGGKEPDWSPAPFNPPPRTPGGGGGGGALGVTLSVLRGQRLLVALARGLKVRAGCRKPCRLRGEYLVGSGLLARSVKVARGRKTLRRAGKTTLVLKFTAKAKRKLRRKRRVRGRLRVRATPLGGGASSTKRKTVTLRR